MMMNRRTVRLVLLLGLGLAVPAGAEETPAEKQAAHYDEGTAALDERRYARAVEAFAAAARLAGPRQDGALYWKAWALSRQGQPSEALQALAELQRAHPQSRWIGDARALEVEIRGQAGAATRPESEDDEDLKLLALNSLIDADPATALPLLRKLLTGKSSPQMRERALFVLSQQQAPEARALLREIAGGRANPDLQRDAIRFLALHAGRKDAGAELAAIYAQSRDPEVREAVLQGFMLAGQRAPLLELARKEPDPELRGIAVRQLGLMGAHAELQALYRSETVVAVREEILQAFGIGGAVDPLLEVARSETDPTLRAAAIRALGLAGRRAGALLETLYASERDAEVKTEVLRALMIQQNDKALIAIARAEKDPELRQEAVRTLGLLRTPAARAYLLELLEK